MQSLPAGFVHHCERCRIVIPVDAPRLDLAVDCESIARHRLVWFNPRASVRHQHTMATAAWEMLHWHAIHHAKHPDAIAYKRRFNREPELHHGAWTLIAALHTQPRVKLLEAECR